MSENSPESTAPADESAPEVYEAAVPGATDADLRTVVLAHPLSREADLVNLGLDHVAPEGGIGAGRKVRVRIDHATSLIGAGYAAGVNPDKPAQVAALVNDDSFADAAPEPEVADQPAEEQPAATVEKRSEAAEAPQTGTEVAPAGSTGSEAPADASVATSADGATDASATTAASRVGRKG